MKITLNALFAFIAAFFMASCADYGPGDFAAGAACGAVQERCTNSCDQRYSQKLGDPDHAACLQACYANKGPSC